MRIKPRVGHCRGFERQKERSMESMRSIKFRAWDKRDRVMYIGVGIEPSSYKPRAIFGGGLDVLFLRTLEDVVLMQFVGIYDKNGKEIYEGDILRRGKEVDNVGEVIWDNDRACFRFDGVTAYLLCAEFASKWYKVVGNIYENNHAEDK
jgi:hypothetical protein